MTQQTRRPDEPDGSITQATAQATTQPLTNQAGIGVRLVRHWLPVVVWMALIFVLSSFSGSSLSDFGSIDFLVKKAAHVTEYAVLCLLFFRAFKLAMIPRKALAASAIMAVIYAVSDEYHQTFVPLREGTVRDVFIDCIGIFLMYLFLRRRHAD